MFKKYKQLIVGILIGFMIAVAVPVGAAIEEFVCYKADYKVMVNGIEYASADLPILNYKGNTYVPFKPMLEAAGLRVKWNGELGQAEVTVPDATESTETGGGNVDTIQYDEITGLPVGMTYVESEKDGEKYQLAEYNGELYISSSDLKRIYKIEQGNLDIKNGIRTLYKGDKSVNINLRSSDYFNANARSYFKLSLVESLMGD